MFLLLLLQLVNNLDIPLTNLQQVYYTMPLQLNNQTYNIVVDTGSSTLWLVGKQTKRNKFFECSQQCKLLDSEQEIQYAIGTVKGVQAIQYEPLQMSILVVNEIEGLDFAPDGLMGLSKPENMEITYLEALYSQKIIQEKSFSLLLTDQSCSQTSILTFGGFNRQHFKGELQLVNAINEQQWIVEFDKFEINSNGKQKINTKTNRIMIDSGTSKLTFPQFEFNELVQKLNQFNLNCKIVESQEINQIQCDYGGGYPSIDITIQNVTLTLESHDYINQCYFSYFSRICQLNFQEMNGTEIVFGVPFMQKYYTYFDFENNQIGFAISGNYNKNSIHFTTFNQYLPLIICLIIILLILTVIAIVLRQVVKSTIPLYQQVLEKSSSRSQEQDHEMITLKTQASPKLTI